MATLLKLVEDAITEHAERRNFLVLIAACLLVCFAVMHFVMKPAGVDYILVAAAVGLAVAALWTELGRLRLVREGRNKLL